MKIHPINRPCDDSYYPGHSTGIAFTTKEAAQAYCDEQNGAELEETYCYYVSKVKVLEDLK